MKKKLIILFLTLFFVGNCVFADNISEVKNFFNNYIYLANTWNNKILTFYSPKAKIIRQVITPQGELVNATTNWNVYKTQLQIGQAVAKARKYTNTYRNISVVKVSNGYKISAERQPKGETYWLKTYQIVQKQNDKWIIVEELMQTKEQIFLKYADKK